MSKTKKTKVLILEVDRKSDLVPGRNPIQIDVLKVNYESRVDVRARTAKAAAEARMGRPASSVRHSENESVLVYFSKGVF